MAAPATRKRAATTARPRSAPVAGETRGNDLRVAEAHDQYLREHPEAARELGHRT